MNRLLTNSYRLDSYVPHLRIGRDVWGPEMPVIYPAAQFGIVKPARSLTYFINYADNSISAFESPGQAQALLGDNVAELCVESVALGSEPSKCAETIPKRSGPSYLYATADGGSQAGYVSVNANTRKISWTRNIVSPTLLG
jgi:hypothetical protein